MNKKTTPRTVALCYVRQSQTRDQNDMLSPQRQRDNIEAHCQQRGWIPEWYQDIEGHKSGREVKNRPGWLALEKRLTDPDVVALVANDLSRIHRRGWRIGYLIDILTKHDVALALTAPGRAIDTFGPYSKLVLQFLAFLDEFYADDISRRAKDSVAHRKNQGKSIGKAPFGTIRNTKGYLMADVAGVWLLANGQYVTGVENELPEGAVKWFGYYAAAERILRLYSEGDTGIENLASKMNAEGWMFCDRKHTPRPLSGDDVRRVVSAWAQYGGIVTHQRSKDFRSYEMTPVEELPFLSERAVFPLDLLRQVAHVRKTRSVRPIDHGRRSDAAFYPLSGLVRCAHCEELAEHEDDPRLRSLLTGATGRSKPRYRHKSGSKCRCQVHSVKQEILDQDFADLVALLTVKPEMLDLLKVGAVEASKSSKHSLPDLESEKAAAIALCKRRIDAAIHLYRDGIIDREEYLNDVEKNERELAHWEAVNTDLEKVVLELESCVRSLDNIAHLWTSASNEERQQMARNMFSYVVYNLESQQIVDFRLKPWADRFLVLRAWLNKVDVGKIKAANQLGLQPELPHTGFEPVSSA